MINMKKAIELTNETDYTIDGRSKKKAYTIIDSGLLDSMQPGTVTDISMFTLRVVQVRYVQKRFGKMERCFVVLSI